MEMDLIDELNSLPVVDAHEHFRNHAQCQPREGVTAFVIESYLASMLWYTDQDVARLICDERRPDRERWAALVRIWPYVRHTGYGLLVSRMLRRWGLGEDLQVEAFEPIQERLRRRSPATSVTAHQEACIEHTVTHHLAHPCAGGLVSVAEFLEGDLPFSKRVHPLLGTLPLHEFFERADVELLEQVSGVSIMDLNTVVDAGATLIERCASEGVVGLKDHAAYTRGLAFGPPERDRAERELQQLLSGERFEDGARALSDYVFDQIVKRSVDLGLPMAIHTGYLVAAAEPKANVRHFVPILEAHPDARFDLYHLNYPWFEDLLAVMKRFRNTWANCCWAHIIDPAGTRRLLQQALGTIPATRIFGFGGDFITTPEPVMAHLDIARENIAFVLGEAIRAGQCSRDGALDVARHWLRENPHLFYGLHHS